MPVFNAVLELSSLNGKTGFQISGEGANQHSGLSVAGAGDVNHDGYADLLIGAPQGGASTAGAAYIVFGRASGFASNFDLSALNGSNGYRINGEAAGDAFGGAVSGAGDVNGDGFADFIVGARYADPNGTTSGASYIIFGKANVFPAAFNAASLDGANGFKLNGVAASDFGGDSVHAAGDINGDGYDDVIVSSVGADPNGSLSGASYVVFGAASGMAASLDLSTLNGLNGFAINGETGSDYSGASVSGAGDVNGDGFDDLLVGARGVDSNGKSTNGAAYLVFGKHGGFTAAVELSALDGTNGMQIDGVADFDHAGEAVADAGDVNGDGFADMIIGAKLADANGLNSGATYVLFGHAAGFGASFSLASLNGSNGFQISGAASKDYAGASVASAGDINGDGYDDLIIGAYGADPHGGYSGSSYVVFGRSGGFPARLDLAALNGKNGFRINGEAAMDENGLAVSSAGDVNGDGFDDLTVGSKWADPNGKDSGATYVIFGHANGTLNRIGTDSADILSGGEWDDIFLGRGGNDRIRAGSGDDALSGGAGNDRLDGGAGDDTVSGGSGHDVIRVSTGTDVLTGGSGGDTLDFSAFGTTAISVNLTKTSFTLASTLDRQTMSGFENLSGARGNDTLTGNSLANVLTGNDGNDNLSGGSGTDTLSGGAGKDHLSGGLGKDTMSGGSGADTFLYLSRSEGGDKISGFEATDHFSFKSSAFGNLAKGELKSTAFVSRTSDHNAQDSSDHFIFQKSTDTLWYDADGKGGAGAVLMADLSSDINLTYHHILIA